MSKKDSMSADKIKFDQGLEKLEEILQVLENGELSLEDSIKNFKEGSKIFNVLQAKLKEAEGEIKVVLEEFGKVKTEDYSIE